MITGKWLPCKREWDFIRENNNIMSHCEMADYFGIGPKELAREKHEMGMIIDELVLADENELSRCLDKFERDNTWEFKSYSYSVNNFLHKKRIYDTYNAGGVAMCDQIKLS